MKIVSAWKLTFTALIAFAVFNQPAAAESAEHGHEYAPNLVAAFVGITSEDRRENGLSLGLEYERRLSRSFGIGALAELTFGDIEVWVFAVPFAFHTGPWKFYVAPGFENADDTDDNESLIRVGGEYGFEVGRWEIAPQLDVDLVDGDVVLVGGVTFGWGF